MSEEEQPTLEEVVISNEKRDSMVTEWILRVVALERALIKKGIVTKEEINESLVESLAEFGQVVASRRGLTDKKS
jgi:hypothetical protein